MQPRLASLHLWPVNPSWLTPTIASTTHELQLLWGDEAMQLRPAAPTLDKDTPTKYKPSKAKSAPEN